MTNEPPPLHPDHGTFEPVGPVARLIADAMARRGWSQREAAAAITEAAWHISHRRTTVYHSAVSAWLDGAVPHPRTRRWIERALDIPLDQLNRAAHDRRISRRSRTVRGAVESEDVKRRTAAQLLALFGVGVATGIDLDRFAAVLAGTRVDTRVLDDMETITLDLIRHESSASPGALMPSVRGHLAGLCDLLVSPPPAAASRTYSLAGQAALLAGYLAFKQLKLSDADIYYAMAEQFGEAAGDVRLRAALLVLRAQRREGENYNGDEPAGTLALLDQAMSLLGPSPEAAVAAHVLTFRARAHAEAHQIEHAMQDLDALHGHLSRMPADDGVYIADSIKGEAVSKEAMVNVCLGRGRIAATDLQRRLAAIPSDRLSQRSNNTTYLAAAYATMGEFEHASGVLGDALQLAAQSSAPRATRRVVYARRRWLADHDGPALRRLDEQLRALPVTSGLAAIPSAPPS